MFEKTQVVRHLGHLDMQRAMQRALRRSGLPIRYSSGFNPHVVLSFASPLPVGATGSGELLDVGLSGEVSEAEFARRFAQALPPELPVVRVRAVADEHPKLMARLERAAYRLMVQAEPAQAAALIKAAPALLAREHIDAIRKTKRGETPCDIRPMLFALTAGQAGDALCLYAQVSFTEAQTLKPDLLLSSLSEQAGIAPPSMRIHREALYGVVNGRAIPLMDL